MGVRYINKDAAHTSQFSTFPLGTDNRAALTFTIMLNILLTLIMIVAVIRWRIKLELLYLIDTLVSMWFKDKTTTTDD